jgi:hypothetical protein
MKRAIAWSPSAATNRSVGDRAACGSGGENPNPKPPTKRGAAAREDDAKGAGSQRLGEDRSATIGGSVKEERKKQRKSPAGPDPEILNLPINNCIYILYKYSCAGTSPHTTSSCAVLYCCIDRRRSGVRRRSPHDASLDRPRPGRLALAGVEA